MTPDLVREIVERIKPLLAGHPPAVQSAALADLLAIWLAGNGVPGNPVASRGVREELLEAHVDLVRELIPINAKMMGAP